VYTVAPTREGKGAAFMITRGFELVYLYDKKVQLLAVLSITK
jgi:hypothetical protein